jgi:ribonuclease III
MVRSFLAPTTDVNDALDTILLSDLQEGVLSALEELVGHDFNSRALLLQSITHSSFSNEKAAGLPGGNACPSDNERLEFLGDAVIGLVVAQILMHRFPEACEGKLSRWRSSLVSRKTLAEIACELKLGDNLLLGRGERSTGGAEKRSILAAGLEALVGALYLDGGLEKASAFLERIYTPWFSHLGDGEESVFKMLDKKTHLQERTQSLYKTTPLYRLVDVWGPEHEKHFRVEIVIGDNIIATGDGRSKKEAEQNAARTALESLGI